MKIKKKTDRDLKCYIDIIKIRLVDILQQNPNLIPKNENQ